MADEDKGGSLVDQIKDGQEDVKDGEDTKPDFVPTPDPDDDKDDFSFVPEKFMKDGVPDWKAMTESYSNLESQQSKKNEELLEQVKADMFKDRPESADKYEDPQVEGWDNDQMKEHPLYNWWKEEAFKRGYSQDEFNEAVQQYATNSAPDYSGEMEKLGDNAKPRIAAVAAFMQTFSDDPETYAELDRMAYTANGIIAIEKLMKGGDFKPGDPDQSASDDSDELTLKKLQEMQSDPRYWNSAQRDAAFVEKVDAGFKKLYGSK